MSKIVHAFRHVVSRDWSSGVTTSFQLVQHFHSPQDLYNIRGIEVTSPTSHRPAQTPFCTDVVHGDQRNGWRQQCYILLSNLVSDLYFDIWPA